MTDAEGLLKGCQEHFRANVTRIKRIAAVISPNNPSDYERKGAEFEKLALGLISAGSLTAFQQQANTILRQYPPVKLWMSWWSQPQIAQMLFNPLRAMDAQLWDSIPDTTNAEEAMHWRLYQHSGRDLSLMDGLEGLYRFSQLLERRTNGRLGVASQFHHYQHIIDNYLILEGARIRYGRSEPWKHTRLQIGRTHKSRAPKDQRHAIAPRYKNDGRPPDTTKALLKPATTLVPTSNGLTRLTIGHPSYVWDYMLCWFDTTMEMIFNVIIHDFTSFQRCFLNMKKDSLLYRLFDLLDERRSLYLDNSENHTPAFLTESRDVFCEHLKASGIKNIGSDGTSSCFVSRDQRKKNIYTI